MKGLKFRTQGSWLALGLLAMAACGGEDDGGTDGPTVQMTVSGTARYEDRAYNSNGFTGQRPQLPIRFATVQLLDGNDQVRGTGSTSASGSFSVSGSVPEGGQVRVSVLASTEGTYNVRVITNNRVYAQASASFSGAAGTRNQDVLATASEVGGAFNILDAAIRGSDLVRAMRPGTTFPRLSMVWPNDNSACPGTSCFVGSSDTLYLVSNSSDTDEYDDDIILHEFGHYISNNFSWDTSPGGAHNPFDTSPEPLALAWSEGFAHWLSSEARSNSGQVDTFTGDNSFFDIEGPSLPSITVGAGNEVAVGAVLWDISDAANERHDTMAGQRAPLWDVVGTFFPSARPDATLTAFCSGWFARGHGQGGPLGSIFANRGVRCP